MKQSPPIFDFRIQAVEWFTVLPIAVLLAMLFLLIPEFVAAQTDPFLRREAVSEDLQSPEQFLNAGRYQEAIDSAKEQQEALGRFGINESLPVLIAKAHMAMGQYEQALVAINAGLERYENSIQIRWVGSRVALFNNQVERSLEMLNEIEKLAKRSSWRYRDNEDQIVLGKYYLQQGADAKQVLKSFYQPSLKRNAADPEVYRAMGQLALDKGDYALAAENFSRLVEIRPNDGDAFFRLAQCFLPSDTKVASKNLNRALEINPLLTEALLVLVDQRVSSEAYDEALDTISKILATHPSHPETLAYRAAIAHLQNDTELEFLMRRKALAHWPGNPLVDHVIGRELSEKYRFEEGQKYQRRALIFDENYLPAKIQLAHDLLRLGQEVEGWKLADEVFDRDQYNVLAHNLVTLRDEMSGFKTLSRDGFIVRMAPGEAVVYGDRVLDLLSGASRKLTEKYQVNLETPIVVEIFPRQRDFAIRTFGLPGGAGFLGVCFGRVITMNSPASQRTGLASWESVLWHEFCHVVTLQKTKNKMPRWLSEGISVYEEKLADSAWGESMSRRYREMLLNELTPVSQLSGTFMRPPSPAHLQFAYFESSLVVEYIIQKHGLPAMIDVLNELSIGTPINKALALHVEPIESLDNGFKEFATARANDFAPKVDWSTPEMIPPDAGLLFWQQWNRSHPNNVPALVGQANVMLDMKQFAEALEVLKTARQLCPEERSVYPGLSRAYRGLGDVEKELETLKHYSTLEASEPGLYQRLLEITSAMEDWESVAKYANRSVAVNPLDPSAYLYLARASESTGDWEVATKALKVVVEMNPLDIADIRYRLAQAYLALDELGLAKREVLLALEQAPRYRAAHQLLLKIVERQANDLPPAPEINSAAGSSEPPETEKGSK